MSQRKIRRYEIGYIACRCLYATAAPRHAGYADDAAIYATPLTPDYAAAATLTMIRDAAMLFRAMLLLARFRCRRCARYSPRYAAMI